MLARRRDSGSMPKGAIDDVARVLWPVSRERGHAATLRPAYAWRIAIPEVVVHVTVEIEPIADELPAVSYRWDEDTAILTAQIASPVTGEGLSGSVDIEGTDGSWLVLDVARGRLQGVEVAVWPDVRTRRQLAPPADVADARLSIPARGTPNAEGISALEVETPLAAEADDSERVIYFRVGRRREVRTVRVASDVLLDLDPQQHIAGLWLLNVPPSPTSRAAP